MKMSEPNSDALPNLTKYDIYRCSHRGIQIKIQSWEMEGELKWTFYVYIHESRSPRFDEIWLPDEVKRFTPVSPERLSHDYMRGLLADIEFHGGITFYAKHGHTEGFRCVEAGCDYSHLWDRERDYFVEDVLRDAIDCVDSLYSLGIVCEENVVHVRTPNPDPTALLIQRNQLRYYLATMIERKSHPFEAEEQAAILKLLEETQG